MIRYYFLDDNKITGFSFNRADISQIPLDSEEVDQFTFPKLVNGILEEDVDRLNTHKMSKLREKRDLMLMSTIWVMQRHQGEKEGILESIESVTTLSNQEYKAWLQYWKVLRDLPESVDLSAYSIDDIETMVMFPSFPTEL